MNTIDRVRRRWRYRPDLATLRGAWWALRALRVVKRRLGPDGMRVTVPAPPALGPGATRGVDAILRRQPATCLERALVLQRWLASQGEPRDVIIGLAGPAADFQAHAWVDGVEEAGPAMYAELHRHPPA
ncbi:MAG TPA: lasso peptide biosynthesis B2 protein [Acidimicrobiales bacterium]|nr:lasso peptide biosynthesis B2 protein [Acidimicrobiales bacterium]